jgi:hypothetical protein
MNQLDELIDESLDRLVPPQVEHGDWEDILGRLQGPPAPKRRHRSRLLLPVAAVLAAVVAALAITTPWHDGPSVIAKASAAIAVAPTDVLHERAVFRVLHPRCQINGRIVPCPKGLGTASTELWVEGGGRAGTFRAITHRPTPHRGNRWIVMPTGPFGNTLTKSRAQVQIEEIGGILGPTHVIDALQYQRYSNTLIRYTQAPTAIKSTAFDPVALIRAALMSGHARDAGNAVIAGRAVRAIDVALHSVDGGTGRATYYVDRSTYAPVEIVYPKANWTQFPYIANPVFGGFKPSGFVVRFSTFATLPSTAVNRALTDIRAQHKTAKVVCGVEFGIRDC